MGLFSKIVDIVSAPVNTIVQAVQEPVKDILHGDPIKAVSHGVGNAFSLIPDAISNTIQASGAENVPVLKQINDVSASTGRNIQAFSDFKLPQTRDVANQAAGAAAIYGGSLLGTPAAQGGGLGSASPYLLGAAGVFSKKPGALNALASLGGDYGSIANSFLDDPYAPTDIAGNPDVETALNNSGVDKARKSLFQSNANKQSLLVPALIGGAGLFAILLFRRKK